MMQITSFTSPKKGNGSCIGESLKIKKGEEAPMPEPREKGEVPNRMGEINVTINRTHANNNEQKNGDCKKYLEWNRTDKPFSLCWFVPSCPVYLRTAMIGSYTPR